MAEGARADLVFSRPPVNALGLAELQEASERLAGLPAGTRLLCLRGAPHFSAGVAIEDHAPDRVDAMLSAIHGFLDALLRVPAMTVAAVRGACLGGGAEIALACDIAVAAEDARIGFPEVGLACFPPAGALLLPGAVGQGRALDLMATGRAVSGREAERIGLVQRAVPSAGFDARIERFLSELSGRPPAALAAMRELVRAEKRARFRAGRAEAEARYREVAATEEAARAISDFLARRR